MTGRLSFLLLLLAVSTSAGWDLKADPPVAVPDWSPTDKLAIPCPTPAENLRFAGQNGPFVLVDAATAKTPVRRVYDLRTGTAVGEMLKPTYHSRSALDPTGTTIAAVENGKPRDVILYSVADKKEIARVTLERDPSSLHFMSAERLLAHSHHPAPQHFTIIDARTGTIEKTWTDVNLTGQGPAISPGGRYFACGIREVLVFDLREGKLVAKLPLELPWLCRGIAISTDGKQLAAFTFKGKEHRLVVWSLDDGKMATMPLPFAKGLPETLVAPVQPVLDGGWFIEQEHLIDAAGKLVRSIPAETGTASIRRAIRSDLVIGIRKVEGLFDSVLSVMNDRPAPVPERTVGLGGIKSPVAFPPTTQVDLSTLRRIPTASEAAWGGPLDASPRSRPRFAFTVPTNGGQVQGLHISRDGGRTCVQFNLGRAVFANVDTGASTTAELPTAFRIVGDSLDGTGWLTTDGEARVDLYDSAGKHVVGWKPEGTNKVVYAAALAQSMAVTVTANGLVTLWSLPACRAVWTADVRSADAACLSPGGKFLVVNAGNSIAVINLENGATHGLLTAPPAVVPGNIIARQLVVRPDGKELALLTPDNDGLRRVSLWNLEAGKSSGSFLVSTTGVSFAYAGSDHLVTDWQVFDLRRRVQVWQFIFSAIPGFAHHVPSDGRIWYSIAAKKPGDLAIVPGEVPTADVSAITASVADAPDLLLQPGEKVRVVVRFDRAPGRLSTDAENGAEKALRARGFVPDANGPVTLRLTGTRRPTGTTVKITDARSPPIGVHRPTIETLTVYDVVFQPEMERDGKVIWSGRADTYSMGIDRLTFTIEIPDESMTATEFFGRKVWATPTQMAGSPFTYPISYAARVDGEIRTLPGQSMLTPAGIATRWPAGYTPKERDQVERAPAERAAAQQAQETAAGAEGTSGSRLRWVIIAGGGALVFMLVGSVVLILILRRKAPGPKRPLPPPLPRRRKS
jgi:hypothetical protein